MALFHLFPVPANWVSLALQIFGGLLFMASLYLTKRIADEINPGPLVPLLAVFLATLKPDIVAQLYGGYNNPETLRYLEDYSKVNIKGFPFFLLNRSPYVSRDAIRSLKSGLPMAVYATTGFP